MTQRANMDVSVSSWNTDELRTRFIHALSEMYRAEVPLYGNLVQIVQQVDSKTLIAQGKHSDELPVRHQLERHGAIRLGTDQELKGIKRLFAILGMHPVGYYNLRIAGFPLHATAFRPVTEDSLSRNPFRVFTSVLRKDLVSPEIWQTANEILERRNLFSEKLMDLITRAEAGESINSNDADDLITEALKIFKWHSRSSVPINDYLTLKKAHPMIADIVCFPSAHINHLTPRTLDIELVQDEMIKQGLPAKERIEGPPSRECPILLRQTSFKALEEQVKFYDANGAFLQGTHTARFGEVEQRGAALTRKGRDLYDQLLASATQKAGTAIDKFDDILKNEFSKYPDSWSELRANGLVHFSYRVTAKGLRGENRKPTVSSHRFGTEDLVSEGLIDYVPITYEDFLPLSAAGIFKSNLGDEPIQPLIGQRDDGIRELEAVLGGKILDPFQLYEQLELDSIEACKDALHLRDIESG